VPDPPQVSIPIGTVPGDDETEICPAILDRLETYRQLAIENPLPTIRQLLPGLEEFEAQIFTLADAQTWGDRIVEQLVNVRREWSTALSAADSGNESEAKARAGSALEYLDAAIDADCPTG